MKPTDSLMTKLMKPRITTTEVRKYLNLTKPTINMWATLGLIGFSEEKETSPGSGTARHFTFGDVCAVRIVKEAMGLFRSYPCAKEVSRVFREYVEKMKRGEDDGLVQLCIYKEGRQFFVNRVSEDIGPEAFKELSDGKMITVLDVRNILKETGDYFKKVGAWS